MCVSNFKAVFYQNQIFVEFPTAVIDCEACKIIISWPSGHHLIWEIAASKKKHWEHRTDPTRRKIYNGFVGFISNEA